MPTMYESSKAMTVTRMATATRLIPVTVGTFDTPKMYESTKTMTNTRMHLQVAIPTVLSEHHSKSFRKYENALAGRHSNSIFRAPFQELSKIKQHLQVAIPTVLSEHHSKSFPKPPTQKPSRNLYNYMAGVRVVVISFCIMFLCIMLYSGCSRVRSCDFRDRL